MLSNGSKQKKTPYKSNVFLETLCISDLKKYEEQSEYYVIDNKFDILTDMLEMKNNLECLEVMKCYLANPKNVNKKIYALDKWILYNNDFSLDSFIRFIGEVENIIDTKEFYKKIENLI